MSKNNSTLPDRRKAIKCFDREISIDDFLYVVIYFLVSTHIEKVTVVISHYSN